MAGMIECDVIIKTEPPDEDDGGRVQLQDGGVAAADEGLRPAEAGGGAEEGAGGARGRRDEARGDQPRVPGPAAEGGLIKHKNILLYLSDEKFL